MSVKGYKAFNKDRQNRYGMPFEEGKTYHVDGDIHFGNYGNGFHFCTDLCDVFRYVNMEEEVQVAIVTGFGKLVKYDDEYYGYYDMYAAENITIDRFLSREEIIKIMLDSDDYKCRKFLNFFRLNEEERVLFVRKFRDNRSMLEWILYYQFGCTKIYEIKGKEKKECLRKVLAYGQNSNKGSKRK